MRVRTIPILASILAVAALGACGSDSAETPDATTITTANKPAGDQAKNTIGVDGVSFIPAEITIAAGESVTFSNPDGVQHTVTPEVAGTFEEAGTDVFAKPNGRHTITLSKPGTVKFFCAIHGSAMSGTITVTA